MEDKYPRQGKLLGQKVSVYVVNTQDYFPGKCIRDDLDPPGRSVFQLDDGRVLLGDECFKIDKLS